jgi:hypothetical protein
VLPAFPSPTHPGSNGISSSVGTLALAGGGSGGCADTATNSGTSQVFGGTGGATNNSGQVGLGGGSGAAGGSSGRGGNGWVWISWVKV